MIKPIPITHSLYKNAKYEFLFFIYPPTVTECTSKYMMSASPTLFFSKTITNYSEFTSDQLQKMRFRITPRNISSTLKFFNEVLWWFYDPEKRDLFIVNNQNELAFNGDYSKLSLLTKRGYFENDVMKAFPAVVDDYNGLKCEGIHLFINSPENVIDLSVDEIDHIGGLLSTFNFYSETAMAVQSLMYTHAINNGTIPQFTSSYKPQ